MNHSLPDEETSDDKWNKPIADVKHYLAFDYYEVKFPFLSLQYATLVLYENLL